MVTTSCKHLHNPRMSGTSGLTAKIIQIADWKTLGAVQWKFLTLKRTPAKRYWNSTLSQSRVLHRVMGTRSLTLGLFLCSNLVIRTGESCSTASPYLSPTTGPLATSEYSGYALSFVYPWSSQFLAQSSWPKLPLCVDPLLASLTTTGHS